MKKILFVIAMAFSVSASAQTVSHTDSTLNLLSKGELVKIYMDQVNDIIDKIPYAVWGLMEQDKPLDVPKSKYILRKRKGVEHDASNYADTNSDLMYEVVYYADKKDLVKSILYLQKVNSDILNVK